MTAGFTFSTMSAKPTGRCDALRLLRHILRDRRMARRIGSNEQSRRTERQDRGTEQTTPGVRSRSRPGWGTWLMSSGSLHLLICSSRCLGGDVSETRPVSPHCEQDGEVAPYSHLSAGLNFGNGKTRRNNTNISDRLQSWSAGRHRAAGAILAPVRLCVSGMPCGADSLSGPVRARRTAQEQHDRAQDQQFRRASPEQRGSRFSGGFSSTKSP